MCPFKKDICNDPLDKLDCLVCQHYPEDLKYIEIKIMEEIR